MSDRALVTGYNKDRMAYLDNVVNAALAGEELPTFVGENITESMLNEGAVEALANEWLNAIPGDDEHIVGKYAIAMGGYSEEARICRDRKRQRLSGHKQWLAEALAGMYEKKKRLEAE